MFEIFQYGFMARGLAAGLIIAIIAPLIGIFLVLRRYSLIADTLSHVSLAGVAIGLITGWNPLITALAASAVSAVAIERMRASKKIYGETALSIFLSGSLALAVALMGIGRGSNSNLFSYLFGSLVTVRPSDLAIMAALGAAVITLIAVLFKELIYISFDEEAASVSGLRVRRVNTIFILMAAMAIALSIPMIGILLISALMIIPVVAALQLKKSFTRTVIWAEIISLGSTLSGIIASFYLSLSPGAAIVLIMLGIFSAILLWKK